MKKRYLCIIVKIVVPTILLLFCIFLIFNISPDITTEGTVIVTDAKGIGIEGVAVCASFQSAGFSEPVYTNKDGIAHLKVKYFVYVAAINVRNGSVFDNLPISHPYSWPFKVKFDSGSFVVY